MTVIRLHPAARREVRQAFEWYLQDSAGCLQAAAGEVRQAFEWYLQEASVGVATGFLDDFEDTLALLKTHPEIAEPGGHVHEPSHLTVMSLFARDSRHFPHLNQ